VASQAPATLARLERTADNIVQVGQRMINRAWRDRLVGAAGLDLIVGKERVLVGRAFAF
jgi:hypothetical protein